MLRPGFKRRIALILLSASFALSSCGGGGGGAGGSSNPSPLPPPPPPPPPAPTITLRTLANQPPVGVSLAMLLTDGSVMAQASPTGQPGATAADFYRLRPDANGDYAGGTWTK